MNAGLTSGIGARPPRTKQFLPGLKWRVSRDTSDNFLIQYSVNGGTWSSLMTVDSITGNSKVAGRLFPGVESGGAFQSTVYFSYGGATNIVTNGRIIVNDILYLKNTLDTSVRRNVAGVIQFFDWIQWVGQSRVATQFDVAASTTLANITGLTATVKAGRTYNFRAVLDCTLDATGGGKWAIGGTATATAINYRVYHLAASSAVVVSARQTALASAVNSTATLTDDAVVVEGLITVNAAGTLTAQFAQAAASGTSSVLVGSTFTVFDVE